MIDDLVDNSKYALEEYNYSSLAEKLVSQMAKEINDMIIDYEKNSLNANE